MNLPQVLFTQVVPVFFEGSQYQGEKALFELEDSGLFTFNFDGRVYKSDTIEELAQIAVREIEKVIGARIAEAGAVYTTLPLNCGADGPRIDFYDAFMIHEKPYRVDLYIDSFRKGLIKLVALQGGV